MDPSKHVFFTPKVKHNMHGGPSISDGDAVNKPTTMIGFVNTSNLNHVSTLQYISSLACNSSI